MFTLMIKTHKITGLKYLCYTGKRISDIHLYTGSGKYWKKHLLKHGKYIDTIIVLQSNNKKEVIEKGIECSVLWNIVESEEWANLRIENGEGGDTVSNKRWITNDVDEKYILKTDNIPEGWRAGRSNKCVFKNSKKQTEFAKRVNKKTKSTALKNAWNNRDINGFSTRKHAKLKGENNPASWPETKKKISKSLKEVYSVKKLCVICNKFYKNVKAHHVKSHNKKNK